eukprot:CAMPEP_0172639562 /NCGR_PEP_ID=MMETSP1068-20121228/218996_1 /TAXON_ID=35684 /ORGANISM="Pseudopedinella elastica, Strain CCMP716" /LENGTH=61 /DNA_ID=CAMNT_0013452745 /DNA_START=1099 /DNA_END=1284 /DNA_ORIENTATION=+
MPWATQRTASRARDQANREKGFLPGAGANSKAGRHILDPQLKTAHGKIRLLRRHEEPEFPG